MPTGFIPVLATTTVMCIRAAGDVLVRQGYVTGSSSSASPERMRRATTEEEILEILERAVVDV